MPALREIFARYDVRFNDSQLRRGARSLDKVDRKMDRVRTTAGKLGKALAGVGAALAGGALLRSTAGFFNELNEANRDVATLAGTLGTTGDRLIRLRTLSTRLTIDWDKTASAAERIQEAIGEAIRNPASEKGQLLAGLGFSGARLEGLRDADPTEAFHQVMGALRGVESYAEQMDISRKLGGDGFSQWANFWRKSAEERRSLVAESAQYSEEQNRFYEGSSRLEDSWGKIIMIIDEVKAAFASDIVPLLETVLPYLTSIGEFLKEHPALRKGIALLTTLATGALLVAGVTWLFTSAYAVLAPILTALTPLLPYLLGIGLAIFSLYMIFKHVGEALDRLGIRQWFVDLGISIARFLGASDGVIESLLRAARWVLGWIPGTSGVREHLDQRINETGGREEEEEEEGTVETLRDSLGIPESPLQHLDDLLEELTSPPSEEENLERPLLRQLMEPVIEAAVGPAPTRNTTVNQNVEVNVDASNTSDPEAVGRATVIAFRNEVDSLDAAYSRAE